jgi:uncharacterized membrane protein HdeD (DUF308 family)
MIVRRLFVPGVIMVMGPMFAAVVVAVIVLCARMAVGMAVLMAVFMAMDVFVVMLVGFVAVLVGMLVLMLVFMGMLVFVFMVAFHGVPPCLSGFHDRSALNGRFYTIRIHIQFIKKIKWKIPI